MIGRYKPKHPSKYKGDPTNIIYRSSYEAKVFRELDYDKSVIQWSSEEFFIPYYDPITNKTRRYFPDIWVKKIVDANIVEQVIEIKPYFQTVKPEPPKNKRSQKSYENQLKTYITNISKWEHANRYCQSRQNTEFIILTEKEIYKGLKG